MALWLYFRDKLIKPISFPKPYRFSKNRFSKPLPTMSVHQDNLQHKQQFQMERIALFSDAVFAIAITLLIIEIKVPEVHGDHINDGMLWDSLAHIIPKFVGFMVSFFVIGLYWLSHHRLFKYVTASSQKLLWANLLFLLPIIVMPFSTGFLSEYYNGSLRAPLTVYMINICWSGFFSYRLWKIIANPGNHLSAGMNKIILRYNVCRSLFIPILFITCFLLSFISPWIPYFMLPFIPLVTRFIKRYFRKKYPVEMKGHID